VRLFSITAISQLALEVAWFDDDMLELKLSVFNAKFAGQANFYAGLDEPREFANVIEGFPRSVSDVREYEFGSTNMPGYGGAKIRFSCKDGSGHLVVQVSVHMNPTREKSAVESATVQLNAVPAAIDSFVDELRRMEVQVGEVAILHNAT
jgi:hypothetical protein